MAAVFFVLTLLLLTEVLFVIHIRLPHNTALPTPSVADGSGTCRFGLLLTVGFIPRRHGKTPTQTGISQIELPDVRAYTQVNGLTGCVSLREPDLPPTSLR